MSRRRLPSRRPSETRLIEWAAGDGQSAEYSVTISYWLEDGQPGEVFATSGKVGSAMRLMLEDACIAISLALQSGVTPAQLLHSMGRIPISGTASRPSSIIGAICEALMQGPAVGDQPVAQQRDMKH